MRPSCRSEQSEFCSTLALFRCPSACGDSSFCVINSLCVVVLVLCPLCRYKAIISDPNRLTSRKGGLSHLKENEMRIRVEKKLPKLEGIIENLVTEWEKENDAVLTINGVRFLVRLTCGPDCAATPFQ